MSALLTEAVKGLRLQPGQTFRAMLDGHAVEVRKLEDDEPTPELAAQVMMLPWTDFPITSAGIVTELYRAPMPLPDPPVIPPEDEVSE